MLTATVQQPDGTYKRVEVTPHYTSFFCDSCKQTKLHKAEFSTGYGTWTDGTKHCFACIADRDRETMCKDGNSKALPLYLTREKGKFYHLSNWPGTLTFPVMGMRSNRCGKFGHPTNYFRFHGPDGYVWTGFQAGHWTQIAHCKRTKERGAMGPHNQRR